MFYYRFVRVILIVTSVDRYSEKKSSVQPVDISFIFNRRFSLPIATALEEDDRARRGDEKGDEVSIQFEPIVKHKSSFRTIAGCRCKIF